MISRNALNTRHIRLLVIDEADEMLQRNFKSQIYDIYRYLPPHTQIIVISATMSNEVLEVSEKFMNDPVPSSKSLRNFCDFQSSQSSVFFEMRFGFW